MTLAKFQTTFLAMCEMYGKEVSKELTQMYFAVLSGAGISDEDLQKAVSHIMATRKYSSLPLPAEILEHAQGSPEDAALIAIQKLETAMRGVGAYDSVMFDDPVLHALVSTSEGGWPGLCQMPLDDWKFEKQRLVKAYKALSTRGVPQQVKQLAGISEKDNAGKFPAWKPTVHQITDKVKPVMLESKVVQAKDE